MSKRPRIDKSALAIPVVPRVRASAHLDWVRTLPCAAPRCRHHGRSEAHHLTCSPDPKAMASKAGDRWAVPLCPPHHGQLHAAGDERAWWAGLGVDPIEIAERLWEMSRCEIP